jgi:RNA ligase
MAEFVGWPKTPRLYRDIVITEKIDGTNAAVVIEEQPFGAAAGGVPETLISVVLGPEKMDLGMPAIEYWVSAQSRKRFITPRSDNYGFAKWVEGNCEALVHDLEAGHHFGEWWGSGIQRGYGMHNRRFSLFNTRKWGGIEFTTPGLDVVPVMYEGVLCENEIQLALQYLSDYGSIAADEPFKPAEGICIYHAASGQVFKVTMEDDTQPKSEVA